MNFIDILLIIIAVIAVLAGGFLIFYFVSLRKHKETNKVAKKYYSKIIDAVGGISNIVEVTNNGSRLTVVLNSYENVNQDVLNSLVADGVGILKYNKKLTLVIGEMAYEYYNSILKELNK